MDIPIKLARKRLRWIAVAVILAASMALLAVFLAQAAPSSVDDDAFVLVEAKQGDIRFEVSAYGTLVPRKEKLLTSPGAATVEEISVRAGDRIGGEQILVSLISPEILERRMLAKGKLDQSVLDLKEAELNARLLRAEEAAKLRGLEADHALEQSNLDALRPIADLGIVAKFELRKVEAKVVALKAQVRDQAQRAKLMNEVSAARISARKDAVTEAEAAFEVADAAARALAVRSVVDGQVQDIYVSVGQGVAGGEKLALVIENSALMARLMVPQGKIGSIAVGVGVELDLQGRKVPGKVSLIDPRVKEGVVQVDVVPDETLPDWARVGQNLTGRLKATGASAAVYMERAIEVVPFSQREIFVRDGQSLVKRRVQFGEESGNYVEVISGLRRGDKVASGIAQGLYQNDVIKIN